MILKITTEPNPILHKVGAQIAPTNLISGKYNQLIVDMVETMYADDGVGIAAPQVGQSIQLCVIAKQYNPIDAKQDLILINPVWEKLSILKKTDEEGCLSVPNIYGKVKRYTKIRVKAFDQAGKPISFIAKDFPARIIQHEVDHLDGILFIEKAKNLHKIEKE
ncbi:MAG: peptide deformylase [Candidatus Magasanikbacteria bacterium]